MACFIAIVLPNNIYAQSDQEEKIILKEDSDIIINDNEEVRRDMLLYDILPEVVLYTSNGTIGINSPHVTIESVKRMRMALLLQLTYSFCQRM